MSRDAEQMLDYLIKATDMTMKFGVTAEKLFVTAVSEIMRSDPDVKLLKQHMKNGGNLSYSLCAPEYEKDLARKFKQEGIRFFKAESARMDGSSIFMYRDKDAADVKRILSEFRLEHSYDGQVRKEDLVRASNGNILQVKGLEQTEATILSEAARQRGIKIAMQETNKGEFAVFYGAGDAKAMRDVKLFAALQKSNPTVYGAIKKQVEYESSQSVQMIKTAVRYDKDAPYYIADMKGRTLEITADRLTLKDPSMGRDTVIEGTGSHRNRALSRIIGGMDQPVQLKASELDSLKAKGKEFLIEKDQETRPEYTHEEYMAMRKMVDQQILYEQKLGMDNPEQLGFTYSFTNSEMRMAEFEALEQVNENLVHDNIELSESDAPSLYEDARAIFRGYKESFDDMPVSAQEISDDILSGNLDKIRTDFQREHPEEFRDFMKDMDDLEREF